MELARKVLGCDAPDLRMLRGDAPRDPLARVSGRRTEAAEVARAAVDPDLPAGRSSRTGRKRSPTRGRRWSQVRAYMKDVADLIESGEPIAPRCGLLAPADPPPARAAAGALRPPAARSAPHARDGSAGLSLDGRAGRGPPAPVRALGAQPGGRVAPLRERRGDRASVRRGGDLDHAGAPDPAAWHPRRRDGRSWSGRGRSPGGSSSASTGCWSC